MIRIKEKTGVPKYKQIISSIEEAIVSGQLKKGDQIPSVNNIKSEFKLSRDTVLMAFNSLKNRGIITSVVGKGYYVSNTNIDIKKRIFLLFDELNSFKEDLYNSFLKHLDDNIEVDIYFHHFNQEVFHKLISDSIGSYNYYVIMPANLENTNESIKNLPQEQVYILDQMHDDLLQYSGIYQNFKRDIYTGLNNAFHLIEKYEKVVLVFNVGKQPRGMLEGFKEFVDEHQFESEIIQSFENRNISEGELYIIPDDKTLIKVIKAIKSTNLKLAKDIGIISYNDTLLKEIVEDGITTISTDFALMGAQLAKMILDGTHTSIENRNNLIIRKSI
jgi:DNA-binding transcriptional regulator YhcF (GntR family)